MSVSLPASPACLSRRFPREHRATSAVGGISFPGRREPMDPICLGRTTRPGPQEVPSTSDYNPVTCNATDDDRSSFRSVCKPPCSDCFPIGGHPPAFGSAGATRHRGRMLPCERANRRPWPCDQRCAPTLAGLPSGVLPPLGAPKAAARANSGAVAHRLQACACRRLCWFRTDALGNTKSPLDDSFLCINARNCHKPSTSYPQAAWGGRLHLTNTSCPAVSLTLCPRVSKPNPREAPCLPAGST